MPVSLLTPKITVAQGPQAATLFRHQQSPDFHSSKQAARRTRVLQDVLARSQETGNFGRGWVADVMPKIFALFTIRFRVVPAADSPLAAVHLPQHRDQGAYLIPSDLAPPYFRPALPISMADSQQPVSETHDNKSCAWMDGGYFEMPTVVLVSESTPTPCIPYLFAFSAFCVLVPCSSRWTLTRKRRHHGDGNRRKG